MKIIRNNIIPEISRTSQPNSAAPAAQNQAGFQSILHQAIDVQKPLQFSKHANIRLGLRDITLTADQIKRVENGVNKAVDKGIRDSLVLVDDIALVVNVKNKVVITAMSGEQENIFTNIDGAVIV